MNRKRIEMFIPIAMDLINELEIVKNGGIPSNYSGYIDTYGPSIRQAGLLQTVSFNEKNEKRKKINKLIFEVLKKGVGDKFVELNSYPSLNELLKDIEKDNFKKKKFEKLIVEAVIACKLAMKTFKKIEAEEE